MSKRRKGGRDNSTTHHSYTDPIASLGLLRPTPMVLPSIVPDRDVYSDRRTYRADRSTAPPSPNRNAGKIVAFKAPRPFHALGFKIPNQVMICVRRKTRKEVMHAKRHAGKGGHRKPRRNFWSRISC